MEPGGRVETPRGSGPTDRQREAIRLTERVCGHGWDFFRRPDDRIGFQALAADPGPGPSEWSDWPELLERLTELKAEVIDVMEGRLIADTPGRSSAVGDGRRSDPASGPVAPGLSATAKRDVRQWLGRLNAAADDSVSREVARRLVDLFRDQDPELSYRTYLGQAEDARLGRECLSVGLLIEVFEEACRPSVQSRGRAWTAAIKRRKRRAFQRSRRPDEGSRLPLSAS